MKREDLAGLGPLHRVLTDMLRDLDTFCRQNGIVYYLAGGTLLGAVRDGGFIPWDDDVDVMMTREHYEKLVSLRDRLPSHLFLQCQGGDPLWHYPYAKLRLNGTVCQTEFSARFPAMHQGIFLDIFVQDKTSDKPVAAMRQAREIRFWHAVVRWLWCRKEGVSHRLNTARPIRLFARFVTLSSAERRLTAAMRRYEHRDTASLIDSSGMHVLLGGYPAAWLGTPRQAAFSGLFLPVPADSDAYLTYLYGDYRTPRETEAHHITEVQLGEYARRYPR